MLQVVPKWRVAFVFKDRSVILWIHETYLSNVLRKVADLQFSENGLEQANEIQISLVV